MQCNNQGYNVHGLQLEEEEEETRKITVRIGHEFFDFIEIAKSTTHKAIFYTTPLGKRMSIPRGIEKKKFSKVEK